MTTLTPTKELLSDAEPSRVLKNAIRLTKQGYTHPSLLKKRILSIGPVALLGIAGIIASILAMTRGTASSESQQLLYVFLLFLSAGIFLASNMGMFLALWSAYLCQYAIALDAKSEAVDYFNDAASVEEAALNLAADPEF